ncbi:MAG TPA: DUF371 domain-containing protein [Nitrososphaerales archaeon]|nr:DUF371 domain-containing protein [Nitrososphaerales archaeon]
MISSRENSSTGRTFSQTIQFRGHENILGTHRNTLEITKEAEISKRADCIIGVRATKSCADLDSRLVNHIRSNGRLEFEIAVKDVKFNFSGFGSENLPVSDTREIVLRKSDFFSPRTLAIHCDAAAIDLPREIVQLLKNPEAVGTMEIFAVESSELPEGTTAAIETLEILSGKD